MKTEPSCTSNSCRSSEWDTEFYGKWSFTFNVFFGLLNFFEFFLQGNLFLVGLFLFDEESSLFFLFFESFDFFLPFSSFLFVSFSLFFVELGPVFVLLLFLEFFPLGLLLFVFLVKLLNGLLRESSWDGFSWGKFSRVGDFWLYGELDFGFRQGLTRLGFLLWLLRNLLGFRYQYRLRLWLNLLNYWLRLLNCMERFDDDWLLNFNFNSLLYSIAFLHLRLWNSDIHLCITLLRLLWNNLDNLAFRYSHWLGYILWLIHNCLSFLLDRSM